VAFEWLGTFNRSQFTRLADFARAQLVAVEDRLVHLVAEQTRVGSITMLFNVGDPQGYVADPDSYIGRLVAAYEVLGGDAFLDLHIRLVSDPVFALKADETSAPQLYSSGEVKAGPGLADAPSATQVANLRGWIDDTLQYRKDYLERKIRRALDYADQLQAEVDRLTRVTQSVDADGSVENIIAQVEQLISDPGYRAIQDDQGKDPHGKLAYAPLAGYEPGADREGSDTYSRTDKGYVIPGGSS